MYCDPTDDGAAARVSSDLDAAATFQDVVRTATHAARGANGADGACIVFREGANCHYVDEDAVGPLWKGQRFPGRVCISGWVTEHRQPAVIPDVYLDLRIPLEAYRSTFVRSLIAVPFGDGEPIGALTNYWADTHLATDAEVARLVALGEAVARALRRVGWPAPTN